MCGLDDYLGDLAHLLLAHPTCGHRRCPEPDAAGHRWWLGVVGNHVLVARHPYGIEHLLKLLAGRPCASEVYEHQVVVRPTGDEVQTPFEKPLGHGLGVLDDLAGVIFELGSQGFSERDGLTRDGMHQRATLHTREDTAVNLFGELLAAEDHASASAPEGFVGRGGDDLAVGYRRRMRVRGDEAGDVGHVREEESPNLVGDLAETVEVKDPRVGARPGDDHTRLLPLRDLTHLGVVYVPVLAYPI